ncbi:MAG: hypothetical protein NC218_03435 [Acetobacter sp.]|nr:hypothetical protein [Acetobacter sp.]
MSHFSVLVTNTHEFDLDAQLAPYDEQVEKGDEYSEFTIEVRHDAPHDFVRNSIAEWVDAFTKIHEHDWTGREEDLKERLAKFKEYLLQDADLMKLSDKELLRELQDSHDYDSDEDGNLGYWSNPNAQWDWYVIGGRWNNDLVLKNGQGANQCKKKDLDIEKTKDKIFAVVHDGEWHQKAEMLWWGITKDERPQDDWEKELCAILDSLTDDAEITLVDCHI